MRKKSPSRPRRGATPLGVAIEADLSKEDIALKLIRGLWDSLESHLDYCVDSSAEGRTFHRQCVREYSDMIQLASKLL